MSGSRAVIQGRIANMDIVPLHAPMGAEIRGLDLARLDQQTFAVLQRVFLDHLLVVVRDQALEERDLLALAQHFGTAHAESGGTGGEQAWHSDGASLEKPISLCANYAAETSCESEGATIEFCNAYAAYDALLQRLSRRVHGMTLRHEVMHCEDGLRTAPGAVHPLVSTHPETGCNALFLGRPVDYQINGLSVKASESLLEELWQHATQPQFRMAHEWRKGDVVLWDNRCTLHRRRSASGSPAGCVLRAVRVRGERPIEAPDARERSAHPRAGLFSGAG